LGRLAQPASIPTITNTKLVYLRTVNMWVILLEALAALLLLLVIVWWTMFSGRRSGERKSPTENNS